MHVKHAALLKLKHAALFLIMQLVLGLIMLCADLARVRFTLIISLPPKKTAPVFLTQLVYIIFLSAFGDIMQTENNGFGDGCLFRPTTPDLGIKDTPFTSSAAESCLKGYLKE